MSWPSFTYQGKVFDLQHLDSCVVPLVVPAQGGKPEQRYKLNVDFSLHCFTRGPQEGEVIPDDLAYSDHRETRIFDFERYELSKQLPGIIANIAERKCFHDKHGNFYVVELVDGTGEKRYYSIFFKLSKAGRRKGLSLFVSSAHSRDEFPYAKDKKPIKFRVIAYNVHHNKKIKRPF